MKNKKKQFKITIDCLVLCGLLILPFFGFSRNVNYVSNRAPLAENVYIQLPPGAVQPQGWLFQQLRLAAEGMTGRLDEIWADVGADNGWLGGKGDSWERGPYWLDGLVPLAYILKDKNLVNKVEKWVSWTLQSQDESGMFGPRPDEKRKFGPEEKRSAEREKNKEDWWPRMVMLKALQTYYEATGDKRVIDFMLRYFEYQAGMLPQQPLDHWTHWAKERGGENLASIYWLYNRTGKPFLLDLGKLVFVQTEKWSEMFVSKYPESWNWHGVNTAMGIKQPAVYYQQSNDAAYLAAVKKGIMELLRFHGQVTGMFSGDELLHGTDPTHGTELCTVVEYMYSLEQILQVTGDPWYADLLEKITYNALPAQVKPDFCARQYFQLPNQIACDQEWHNFITKHKETELLFGLETGYGCCTANFHQGWPKYVAQLWLATQDNGLAALSYAPCEVTAKTADNIEVTFMETTNYPFSDTVIFSYKSAVGASFPLHLRIPGWCEKAAVYINEMPYEGELKPGSIIKINRKWEKGDEIKLHLPMKVRVSPGPENSAAVELGPLVFALKLNEKWEKIAGQEPFADYKILTADAWNYGILRECLKKNPADFFNIKMGNMADQPWTIENAPIEITVKGKKIPGWKQYGGVAGPIPYSPDYYTLPNENPVETLTLIPYGCTKIRISLFPLVY